MAAVVHTLPLSSPLTLGALLAAALSPAPAAAQARSFPDVPIVDRFDPDSAWSATLEATGDRFEAARAVLYVPAGSLTAEEGRAMVDTLDRAVTAVEELVGGPHPWQRFHHPQVRYYAPDEPLISHVNGGARVYVSLERLRSGTAPWVHETAHALLAPRRDTLFDAGLPADPRSVIARHPFWLHEGIADVIALAVADRTGIVDFDVFEDGPVSPPGPRCRRWLEDERGRSVLPFIGTAGRPAALMYDRENVAPPFYVCSHAFTRFLVDRHGIAAVAALLDEADVPAALARLEGRSVEAVRDAWLSATR